MAEPTLLEVFGANASQTATDLIISKADLTAVGLTASATNTPESLLIALLKRASTFLKETSRDTNPDQSVVVSQDSIPSFVTRINGENTITYVRNTLTVELDKLYSSIEIDPDDY